MIRKSFVPYSAFMIHITLPSEELYNFTDISEIELPRRQFPVRIPYVNFTVMFSFYRSIRLLMLLTWYRKMYLVCFSIVIWLAHFVSAFAH